MRDALSKKIVDIEPSGIRKFFDIVSEMPDAISLGVGEPDFDTPYRVREEGIYSLEKGRTFYTSNAGLKELRDEISRYIARKYNLNYSAEDEIMVTVGGSEAIDVALRCMVDPGDEVLIPQPCYVSYVPCAVMADAKPVAIELKAENEFKLTKEELIASITDKTKILILAYPNNPTGAIMTKEELAELVPVIIDNDLYVISDEIYSELTYGSRHCSIASFPGMKERTVVINGFSKAFAMTGWRLGYACAFKEMGIECFEPYGAFYVFPSIKKFGMTSDEFANRLLFEQKLAVVPGTAFGASGEGFVRISYAYSVEKLKAGLERIENFIKNL